MSVTILETLENAEFNIGLEFSRIWLDLGKEQPHIAPEVQDERPSYS